MSLFLDTGVFVAFSNGSDAHHREAVALVKDAMSGRWGRLVTSDYVMDEAVTVALSRTHRADVAVRVGELILGLGPGGRFVDLAYVTPQTFLRAWNRFRRHAARGLSLTDCTSVELVQSLRLDAIASFDRGFDGLVPRRVPDGD